MHFFDSSKDLTFANPAYLRAAEVYIWETYKMDVAKEDVTTRFFVTDKNQMAKAYVITRESGILAGVREAEWFLNKVGIQILNSLKDGQKINAGDHIMELRGPAVKIFPIERTLINLFRRMSGIATTTKRWRDKLPKNIKLTATRKVFWGLLDKRAASLGGALSHRLNLNDAVLVKINHLDLRHNWEGNFINVLRRAKNFRFLEVKVANEEQINRLLPVLQKIRKKYSFQKRVVVLFDQFSLEKIRYWAPVFQDAGMYVEVTGKITEDNLLDYVIPGVDAISAGMITTHPAPLDIILNIKL